MQIRSEFYLTFKVLYGGWDGKEEKEAITDVLAGETALGYTAELYDSWPRKGGGWTVVAACAGMIVAEDEDGARQQVHQEHKWLDGIVSGIQVLVVIPHAEDDDV